MKDWKVKCIRCEFIFDVEAINIGKALEIAKNIHPHDTNKIYLEIADSAEFPDLVK